jgi:hypothetical protein
VAAEGSSSIWSQQDIQLAHARCTALLKELDVVAVPESPLREGTGCGTPAPMRLISLGSNPEVALSPPPVVTCDMIAALHKWLRQDVQPLARKFLGAPIVRIETMSSYSCRNAYGRTHGRLSEHARANAVDLGSFVTARGQAALVVADWGPTAREIAIAAAARLKPAREPAPEPPPGTQVTTVVQSPDKVRTVISVAPADPPGGISAASAISGFAIPGLAIHIGGDKAPDLGLAAPSRLGGPKPGGAAAGLQMTPDSKTDFLRAAHAAACRIFGTVLGPEANSWHRNHFHLDMADRPHGVICE